MDTYPNDADGDALRRIAENGTDMTKPISIDFAVSIPDQSAGESLASKAEKLGFSTDLWQDSDSGDWTCYCSKTMLATYEGVVSTQAKLDELAAPLGGFSDGWGTYGNEI